MITEGWYVPKIGDRIDSTRVFARWVLGVRDGMVCYSKGGEEHFFCLPRTFANWVKRTAAQLQTREKLR